MFSCIPFVYSLTDLLSLQFSYNRFLTFHILKLKCIVTKIYHCPKFHYQFVDSQNITTKFGLAQVSTFCPGINAICAEKELFLAYVRCKFSKTWLKLYHLVELHAS